MKKLLALFLSACCFFLLTQGMFIASPVPQSYGWDSIPASYDEMHEKLASETKNSGVNVLRFQTLVGVYYREGEEEAFNQIDGFMPCTEIIQWFVTYEHAFGNHVDELIAMGYTDVDYSPVLSSTPATSTTPAATPTPAPAPTAFVVAPLEPPKTMWATQQVNYRDGADTTYNKVGQLKKHDQITVVGIASTNWYQFSLDGGATYVYASNNYFTDVDPSNRSVIIDNPETAEPVETVATPEETETVTENAITSEEVPTDTEEVVETEGETVTESSEAETQSAQTLQTEEELPVTVEVTEEETEEPTTVSPSEPSSTTDSTTITETVTPLSWTYIIIAIVLVGIVILSISLIIKQRKEK